MDVAQLSTELTSNNVTVRVAAAERLAALGEVAQPAALALVTAMGDSDSGVRDWAFAALESLGPPLENDLPALAKLLSDPRLDVAYWAATLLGRLGASARPAASALTSALASHPELAVRQRVAWALGETGAKEASQALNNAATSSDPRLARMAQQAMAKLR